MEPTIRTPPLVTPTAPTMSRAGPDDDDGDGDGASSDVVSLTRALLAPRDKAEVVREIIQAASEDHDGVAGHLPGYGEDPDEPPPPQAYRNAMSGDRACACHTSPLASALFYLSLPVFCLPACGSCLTVYPKNAVVTTVYGRFFHNFTSPGLYFVNPCGREAQVVSLKTTSVELQAVKVADANGNPLVISGVVNYRVVDATRAALDVLHLGNYVKVNAHASLKRVASLYPYETRDGAPSLKTEVEQLSGALRALLQRKTHICGVKIVSFELSDLSYAAEVAPMMLVRQQAQALIDARSTIVAGSVSIVHGALAKLEERGHALGDRERARLMSNMMTVLAGESRPLPTLSLSEVEFHPQTD